MSNSILPADTERHIAKPYDTAAILRQNVADLERELLRQRERADRAEAELAKLREQEPVAKVAESGRLLFNADCGPDQYRENKAYRGPLYAAPVPAVAAPAVPRKYHEFASVMLDAQPFITAETYGGRYIVAMRFERLGKMQDCHAALLALLQSGGGK